MRRHHPVAPLTSPRTVVDESHKIIIVNESACQNVMSVLALPKSFCSPPSDFSTRRTDSEYNREACSWVISVPPLCVKFVSRLMEAFSIEEAGAEPRRLVLFLSDLFRAISITVSRAPAQLVLNIHFYNWFTKLGPKFSCSIKRTGLQALKRLFSTPHCWQISDLTGFKFHAQGLSRTGFVACLKIKRSYFTSQVLFNFILLIS